MSLLQIRSLICEWRFVKHVDGKSPSQGFALKPRNVFSPDNQTADKYFHTRPIRTRSANKFTATLFVTYDMTCLSYSHISPLRRFAKWNTHFCVQRRICHFLRLLMFVEHVISYNSGIGNVCIETLIK